MRRHVLLSHAPQRVLAERVTRRRIAGTLLVVIGVVLISVDWRP
jgi:drug/metabolite transporter (DMT)-like permease